MANEAGTEGIAPGTENGADAAALAALAAEDGATDGAEGTPAQSEGGEEASEEDIAYARSQGWVEKEKYRGDKAEWADAKTFADRARQINPIINARNRTLAVELAEARRQIEQLRQDSAEALDMVRAQARRDYDTQLTGLKAQRAAAIDDGDGATVQAIEDKIAGLKVPEEKKPAPANNEPSPALVAAVQEFGARNPWYGDGEQGDPEKTGIATAAARTLLRERPDLRGNPAFFAELEYQLKADHPELFGRKATPRMVDNAGRPGVQRTGTKRTVADLPKEAQETAKRYERNGWLKAEEYAKNYFAEQDKQ
jgi:hypothetical protein